MSEVAGNLPCKFISFRHLGVEPSAHKLPEERESENPQNVLKGKKQKLLVSARILLSQQKFIQFGRCARESSVYWDRVGI